MEREVPGISKGAWPGPRVYRRHMCMPRDVFRGMPESRPQQRVLSSACPILLTVPLSLAEPRITVCNCQYQGTAEDTRRAFLSRMRPQAAVSINV